MTIVTLFMRDRVGYSSFGDQSYYSLKKLDMLIRIQLWGIKVAEKDLQFPLCALDKLLDVAGAVDRAIVKHEKYRLV